MDIIKEYIEIIYLREYGFFHVTFKINNEKILVFQNNNLLIFNENNIRFKIVDWEPFHDINDEKLNYEFIPLILYFLVLFHDFDENVFIDYLKKLNRGNWNLDRFCNRIMIFYEISLIPSKIQIEKVSTKRANKNIYNLKELKKIYENFNVNFEVKHKDLKNKNDYVEIITEFLNCFNNFVIKEDYDDVWIRRNINNNHKSAKK